MFSLANDDDHAIGQQVSKPSQEISQRLINNFVIETEPWLAAVGEKAGGGGDRAISYVSGRRSRYIGVGLLINEQLKWYRAAAPTEHSAEKKDKPWADEVTNLT